MRIQTSKPNDAIDDPRVRAVARSVLRTGQLAAQKAALHFADPRRFPIDPAARSIESLIVPVFKALPPARQEAARGRALASLSTASAERAASSGVFAAVNFESAVPVEEQVHSVALAGAGGGAAARLIGDGGWLPDFPRRGDDHEWPPTKTDDEPTGGGNQPLKRMVLALHSLTAVKDTPEWGKDEIYLGATAAGITTQGGKAVASPEIKVDAFSLGSFKKGQTRSLNDRVLYAFYPPPADQYPGGYAVTLLMLEKDHGKAETIRKALKSIEDKVIGEINKWAKEIPGFLGQIAQLVLKVLPPLLGKLFDFISNLLGDDLFDPATISLSVNSPDSRLPGDVTPRETVSLLMKGGDKGRYDLTYSWHVFA